MANFYDTVRCPSAVVRDDDAPYVIRCEVSGGVTGRRTHLLKNYGYVVEFATRKAAEARARQLTKTTMDNPYRTANFSYTAEKR